MPARLDQRSTRQRRQDVCGLLQPLFGHPGLHTLFARNRHRVVLRQQRVLTCGFILRGAGRLRGRKLHTPFFGDTEPDAAADSQPDVQSNTGTNPPALACAHAIANACANFGSDEEPNALADSQPNVNADERADEEPNSRANSEPDRDAHRVADERTDAEPDVCADIRANAVTYAAPVRRQHARLRQDAVRHLLRHHIGNCS